MWIYIVSWALVTVSQAPCPDARKVDEFGRGANLGMSCAVLHTKLDTIELREKRFCDRDSAIAFIGRTKNSNRQYGIMGQFVENVKIDSIFIKE